MAGTSAAAICVTDATVSYGAEPILHNINLSVEAGSSVAMLGPSGCGKTTLLRAIAGLEKLSAGEISLDGRLVSSATTNVAPEKRRVGMVFQDWALFPHLSVRKNIAYGLNKMDGADKRVDEVLEMVGLSGYADRAPHTLSGGQQQRVALARALAPRPTVLLLDEPFSNLDSSMRVDIRADVHRLLNDLDVTSVFVTHDQDEAFILGDQVAVMHERRVVQVGTPSELYAHPVTPWIGSFVGEANLVAGIVENGKAVSSVGTIPVDVIGDYPPNSPFPASVLVRPEDLGMVHDGDGTVSLIEYYGHDTTYEVVIGDETIRVRLASAPKFERGESVSLNYVGGSTMAYTTGV